MGIKLLRGQSETVEKDGIKLVVKVVSTAEQARVLDRNSRSFDVQGRCALFSYLFSNCLESIIVEDDTYVPEDLANNYNIADDDTFETLEKIARMTVRALGIRIGDADTEAEDEEKKSD